MKIFFHSADLDGHCSAAIVKMKYPGAELIGINYGQPFPFDKLIENEIVIMVDFSLQPFTEMFKLAQKVGMDKLTWIDHHVTAIKDADECVFDKVEPMNDNPPFTITFNNICPGKREIGKAGCELTWDYFYPDDEMPAAVSFLGRYDVWDLQGSVLPFQYGMRLNNTWPNNQEMWQKFLQPDDNDETTMLVVDTIRSGETILKYQKQENEKYTKSAAFEVLFEGHKAICINKLLTNSQLFESVWDKEKYDIMIAFGLRSNGTWTMSFYTDKDGIDVSLLAKKLGGGGHKQASGCSFEELPIEFLRQVKKLLPNKGV
jgi:oligoribonuclease NrnB/cAMP/cGMP phosphodiesterase (DHH superfamily)